MNRSPKVFSCVFLGCSKSFPRSCDLRRHGLTHGPPEERPFPCPVEGCEFRANQRGGLTSHHNGVHEKRRLPCSDPSCHQTFSDPSSRSKHRQRFHSPVESNTRGAERAKSRKRTTVARYARVRVKKNDEDVQCAAIVVQALSSDIRPSGSTQSDLSGGFHPARDVKTGHRVSNDSDHNELTHQAYDAKHHQAATWAYSYPRDVARLRTQVPIDLPNSSVRAGGNETGVAGGPILLAPQRGQRQDAPMQAGTEHNDRISHPTCHVPQGTYYGFQNSSAYYFPRPSPRLLFHSSSR